MLTVPSPIVSTHWLAQNLYHPDLVILDASMPKVGQSSTDLSQQLQIEGARFFDIKNRFSDLQSPWPNTIPPATSFSKDVQQLGIHHHSAIVVYDTIGVYSSPRAWWLFQAMGHANIAVLDGGLPAWQDAGYPCIQELKDDFPKGNFVAELQSDKIAYTDQVLASLPLKNTCIIDARSTGRFNGTAPEPRKELKSGHIPNSYNLPFEEVLHGGQLKPKEELATLFQQINPLEKPFVCTCGSGITASILALATAVAGYNNTAVYDGSWSEWAANENLPIATF